MINDGDFFIKYVVIPFIAMSRYKDVIHQDWIPAYDIYYFAIYCSLLVYKYKQKLNDFKAWKDILRSKSEKIVYKYYGLVLTIFADKKSKDNHIMEVYNEQKCNYVNQIVEYRDRIFCANKICKINYYFHKYDSHSFSKEMWDGRVINKWWKCERCRMVYYCSRKCQKYDWNRHNHKQLCDKFL